MSWKCPRAASTDRHHVLAFHDDVTSVEPINDNNPFLSYQKYLHVDAFGEALGIQQATRTEVIAKANANIAQIAGTGFIHSSFQRANALSDELGFSASGGVWIKDETHNVAGSHKARHIFTELLHLLFAEHAGRVPWPHPDARPSLAIASCGNAAIAASTLAASAQWPIQVFVPVTASQSVLDILHARNATVVTCPRRDEDPPGDPCVHRFREAVEQGAIPFGVQGTENAWCLDGGRTIGWEIAHAANAALGAPLDRIFIQVGGGAFASCVGAALAVTSPQTQLHAVQAQGCAPLSRAWHNAQKSGGTRDAGPRWDQCMWAWESEPHSLADGILDDETYDWISVLNAMTDSGGFPIVASEAHVTDALALADRATDISASPTGTAGLAGVLAIRDQIGDHENIAIVFSGVARR